MRASAVVARATAVLLIAASAACAAGDGAPPAEQPRAVEQPAPVNADPVNPAATNTAPPAIKVLNTGSPPASPGSDPPRESTGDNVATSGSTPPTTSVAALIAEAHEKVATNAPSLLAAEVAPLKRLWEAERGGFTASRLAIANRLVGRPNRLLSAREKLPRDREAFLWRVARDTWNGLQAYTDRPSGLVVDNVRVVGGLVPPLALKVGDYTNITNVGLQLAAIVAARGIGLVPDSEAREQISRVLDTLAGLDRHSGYYFNYYDTTTLEPTSSFLSFVDTAWLVAGLIVARQRFPEFDKTIDEILEPIDFGYFYDDRTGLMSHGYYVGRGVLSTYEYGMFYTEARLGSIIAIGKGEVPPRHWYAMRRASKPVCANHDCPELHRLHYQRTDGTPMSIAHFRWRSYEYVPSWGGSMFEALMPRLVLDEGRWAPRSLGPNGQAHAQLQKLYATEILGFPVWGMSPCISPDSLRYREFGVRVLGAHGYDDSVVTPHATALALAVAPDDAVETLMELASRYDIYGPFGFYDAVAPETGKVAYDQLALDQLMLFLSVANYLSGGEVPMLFASDPWIRGALPVLAEERFFQ